VTSHTCRVNDFHIVWFVLSFVRVYTVVVMQGSGLCQTECDRILTSGISASLQITELNIRGVVELCDYAHAQFCARASAHN